MNDYCPMCDAENSPMGLFGSRLHYRCRACGWTFSVRQEEPEDEREDLRAYADERDNQEA